MRGIYTVPMLSTKYLKLIVLIPSIAAVIGFNKYTRATDGVNVTDPLYFNLAVEALDTSAVPGGGAAADGPAGTVVAAIDLIENAANSCTLPASPEGLPEVST
jgi:hypothetical protein